MDTTRGEGCWGLNRGHTAPIRSKSRWVYQGVKANRPLRAPTKPFNKSAKACLITMKNVSKHGQTRSNTPCVLSRKAPPKAFGAVGQKISGPGPSGLPLSENAPNRPRAEGSNSSGLLEMCQFVSVCVSLFRFVSEMCQFELLQVVDAQCLFQCVSSKPLRLWPRRHEDALGGNQLLRARLARSLDREGGAP